MLLVPTGYLSQETIAKEVERARQKLGPDVVRLKYSVGEDISGEPAIHFRIVLTDEASVRARLGEAASQIVGLLINELHPIENWGLLSYFRFRSQSEQAARDDVDWA